MNRPLVVLVRGCGDVGSAVAHRLFLRGAAVIVHDHPAPAHPRRGMAFTDALFEGSTVLEGVMARYAGTLEPLRNGLQAQDHVPVLDVPLDGLLEASHPHAVVDARMRKRSLPEDQRSLAPSVVGLGPGFVVGRNCTVAIETGWGPALGKVVCNGSTAALAGEPRRLAGVGRERFVYAPCDGEWQTALGLGASVMSGQEIGQLGGQPIRAPWTGVLRGLSHDRVRVLRGQKIVEVDPRCEPDVVGLGTRPNAIARGVSTALGLDADNSSLFFGFESAMERELQCMPMSVRMKLDLCGRKVSLAQWRLLAVEVRQTLLEARCTTPCEIQRVRQYLERIAETRGLGALPQVECHASDWQDTPRIPAKLTTAVHALGLPSLSAAAWAGLSDLQRFALVKLAREGHTRNLPSALQEFGLTPVRLRAALCQDTGDQTWRPWRRRQQLVEQTTPLRRVGSLPVAACRGPIQHRLDATAKPRGGLGLAAPDRFEHMHDVRQLHGVHVIAPITG